MGAIGLKIRELRELKGWSIRELADAAGITHTMVTKYENDKSYPARRTLRKIAAAFNVPYNELTSAVDSLGLTDQAISPQAKSLALAISLLDPAEQLVIKELIESLLDRPNIKNDSVAHSITLALDQFEQVAVTQLIDSLMERHNVKAKFAKLLTKPMIGRKIKC